CVLVYSRCPAATDTYTLSLHDALPISHRHVSAGHALGAGDDVGLVAVALRTEVLTEPAEGADHLVRHQQHVVPVADLPHALEVAGRRWEAAACVLHRLEVHRGDGVRALHLDGFLDAVGRPATERLRVAPVRTGRARRRPVHVGVRHADRARHQRFELLLGAGQAGDGQRPHRGAVVGDRPGDDLVFARLTGQLEVRAG